MKKATVSDLKNHLSFYLRAVKGGEPVLVLDRGVPIAELQKITGKSTSSEDRLTLLERKGLIRRGNSRLLKGFPFPTHGEPSGVLKALLEERRGGR